jgi:hypothetical protein
MGDQSAAASALGYYFQGSYALIVLLDADDTSSVSLETADDITLEGSGNPKLLQLKHSTGTPAALTETNVGFWKAIGNWINASSDARCLFVTCATVSPTSALLALVPGSEARTRADALQALAAEASKVTKARGEARKKTKKNSKTVLPFKDKGPHCEAFDALTSEMKLRLVKRITILPNSTNLGGVVQLVDERLRPIVEPQSRAIVRQRLLEWWDYRISRSLLNEASRNIAMAELQRHLTRLISEADPARLSDDFHLKTPEEPSVLFADIMAKQIGLVNGGESRLRAAGLARWRALEQRARWLDEDASLQDELKEYDAMLKERWGERHGPLVDDTAGQCDSVMSVEGRKLLDWALRDAPGTIEPIRPSWIRPFLVAGTLQDFANRLDVGWHPNYLKHLSGNNGDTDEG